MAGTDGSGVASTVAKIVTPYLLKDKLSLAILAASIAVTLLATGFHGLLKEAYLPVVLSALLVGLSIFAWRARKLSP